MKLIYQALILLYFSICLCRSQAITLSTTAIKSDQANSSGLKFTNLTSASSTSASNGKALSVDATGNVILTLNQSTTSYWQMTGNDIVNTNTGVVKINNFQVGNSSVAVAGSIRWNGADFEGYNGSAWVSFTQAAKIIGMWVTAPTHGGTSWYNNVCAITCPANLGYVPGLTPQGNACNGAKGSKPNVTADGSGYWCGSYTPVRDNTLYQCYCVKVN